MIASDLSHQKYKAEILWIAALPVLYYISRQNYNLFHSLADGVSIVIAVSVFMIIWNTRRFLDNDYLLYFGISFLFFALLDLIHVLGNKDMGVFPAYGNLGPALYIASRYVISISLLVAPFFVKRKLNTSLMFTVYSLATAFILLSIFYWRNFPVCIVEGVGLTPFKVISDYIICLILLGAIGLLFVHRGSFEPRVFWIVVSSIILFIATGVAFTSYADPFGITNAVGHFFQIGSFYLVYLAIIETSLTKPQDVLYRKLKQSEEELAESVKRLDHANAGLNQEITAHKQAEEALRESETKYRNLFENMTEEVHFWKLVRDESGQIKTWRLVDANPPTLKTWGRTSLDEIRGKTTDEIFGPGATDHYMPVVRKIMTEGVPYSFEDYFPNIDKHFRFTSVPLGDHFITTGADITSIKKAEEGLRRSEALYRSIATNFPNGAVYVFDRDMRFLVADGAAIADIGWSRDKLEGMCVGDLDEETRRIIEPRYRRVLAGESFRFETPYHGRIMFSDYVPIKDEAGQVIMGMVVSADVTERKLAEEKLLETQTRTAAILKGIADTFYSLDDKWRFTVVNPAAEQAPFGRPADELLGRVIWELYPHLVGTRIHQHYLDAARKHTLEHYMAQSPLNGGWYEVFMQGWKRGVDVYMRDITERKSAEEELHRSRDELEMRVKERTAELELRNKELQDFAFVASHDLQEPLRKIQTFGNMLVAKCSVSLDQISRDYIDRMQKAAGRMQSLLNSLLSYSRVTTKADPMKRTELRRCVKEALSNLEIVRGEKNAVVGIGDLPTIKADPVQMAQLFQNLIGNALKFHRDGEAPHVKIHAKEVGNTYEIYVEDNGIGFDEKYLDKIFLPFQRLHGRSSEYEGVGMGLAICKKIVERLGGKITAKSELGKGSTFVVTLPEGTKMR
jgi:PAS domain S-box-containing protein